MINVFLCISLCLYFSLVFHFFSFLTIRFDDARCVSACFFLSHFIAGNEQNKWNNHNYVVVIMRFEQIAVFAATNPTHHHFKLTKFQTSQIGIYFIRIYV